MLEHLGLDPTAEAVYRLMLQNPSLRVSELAEALGLGDDQIRSALDALADLSLVRSLGAKGEVSLPVSPLVGLQVLIAAKQARIAEQQRTIDESRAAMARFIAECDSAASTQSFGKIERVFGVQTVRLKLQELSLEAAIESCSFAPDGPQTPENRESSKPLIEGMLRRGAKVRTIYLDSLVNDPASFDHARWLMEMGGEVRTRATLPLRMHIIDRRVAVLALQPDDSSRGAVFITEPGPVAVAYSLFETIWELAKALEHPRDADKNDDGLSATELAVLRMLAKAMTDEAIARRLGVSLRTERRIITKLMERFNAQNRFQLGQQAARRGIVILACPQGPGWKPFSCFMIRSRVKGGRIWPQTTRDHGSGTSQRKQRGRARRHRGRAVRGCTFHRGCEEAEKVFPDG